MEQQGGSYLGGGAAGGKKKAIKMEKMQRILFLPSRTPRSALFHLIISHSSEVNKNAKPKKIMYIVNLHQRR